MGPGSLSVVLLLLALPAPAGAQDAIDRSAAARALFDEGIAFADRGEWEQAADRFERAYALRDAPQIGVNLAAALGHVGRVVQAAEVLRQVQHRARSDERVRAAADALLGELEPRAARLTVHVEGDLDDIEVALDGVTVDRAVVGVAIPVDPGPHHVSARRDDEEVAAESVTLAEGQRRTVHLVVPGTARVATPDQAARTIETGPPETVAADGGGSVLESWWLWAGVGAVVAGVVVVVLVVGAGGAADPVAGNGDPPVLRVGE